MNVPIRIQIGDSLIYPQGGARVARVLRNGVYRDATIDDVVACPGIPVGVKLFIVGTDKHWVSVPFGTGDIGGNGVDWSEDIASGSVGSVPSTRRVDTTLPLQGGGELSSDLTLSILDASGMTRGTMSVEHWEALEALLAADIITFTDRSSTLPNSHYILINESGGALLFTSTGPNTLSLSAPFGTTEDTYMEGNDERVVNAIPSSRTLTGTSPIRIDGGNSANLSADRTISISAASAFAAGSMSSTHFTRVNGIPDATPALHGYLLTPSAGFNNIYILSTPSSLGIVIGSERTITGTSPVKINGGSSATLDGDITVSVNSATAVSLGVVALTGDLSGTATDVVVVGLNEAAVPSAPQSDDVGKIFCATDVATYGLLSLLELGLAGWSVWGSRVTVASGDASKAVLSVDFTDANRAGETWTIRVDFECLMRRVSDPTQPTCLFNSILVTAVYNGSGVPSLLTTSESSDKPFEKWQGGGVPVITDFDAAVSGATIVISVYKSGGVDCYAKCRVRKCTEERLDNW